MIDKIRPYLGWALLGLLLLFIVFNLSYVKVHLLIMQLEMPIALLIAGSAALGAGAVYALAFVRKLRTPAEPK